MRKLVAVLGVVLGLSSASCAAWWQNFKSDPVAQVQVFEESVQTALNIADIVWRQVESSLPASTLAKAQDAYNKAVLVVNKALTALGDAVQAAEDVKQSNPDFTGAIQAVNDAVQQVIAVVDEFKGQSLTKTAKAPTATELVGYAELKAAGARVSRWVKGH